MVVCEESLPHPIWKGTALSSTNGCQCRNTDPNMAKLFQFVKRSHISRLFEEKNSQCLQFGNLFQCFKKKKTHSNDPNKHICRADLRGLACRSQSATSAPLVLFVSDSHHNFCFFQELFLSLNRYLSPTSMAFPGPVVFLKDIQESHSFLKEYERGHIKEGFLELSKWSQGKHQENLFLIAQLLNCQRLLFGNTHECKSSSKALNFTTIVVMTSVFQSTKCQTKPSSALSNRQCLPTTTYPRRW